MNNLPRRPVRFQPGNDELLKSQGVNYEEAKDKTDYIQDTTAPVVDQVQGSYRTPHDRVNGSKMFRRYLDGRLDMEHACGTVIDAIHRYKQKDIPVGTQECVALQAIFPGHFDKDVDPMMAASVAAVNLDLVPEETAMIRIKVAAHLAEEMNWNAGMGGGSTPGRNQTYDR